MDKTGAIPSCVPIQEIQESEEKSATKLSVHADVLYILDQIDNVLSSNSYAPHQTAQLKEIVREKQGQSLVDYFLSSPEKLVLFIEKYADALLQLLPPGQQSQLYHAVEKHDLMKKIPQLQISTWYRIRSVLGKE